MKHRYTSDGERLGVVLFQLGGPDSLQAIEPFLYNLFSDPDIIYFPFARLAREPLARLIASKRARKVQEHYAEIGGKSPIRELTERQARALEQELCKTLDTRVVVAMRYWHPLTEEAVRRIQEEHLRPLVLLPLYPQYSLVTTGSSLNEWRRRQPPELGEDQKVVREFYDHPLYLDAVVEKIQEGLERLRRANGSALHTPEDVHLLFSAHSVPVSVIRSGDPYQAQIEATVKLVMERGGWKNPHSLCYQSRSGPGRWLQPFLAEALEEVAARGAERVLVIPISFVSDHVETLHEIAIEGRELAERRGFHRFECTSGLNDSPKFIAALADLVLKQVGVETAVR